MENLKIRKYVWSDIERIEHLFRKHHTDGEVPTRKLIFDWIARKNPVFENGINYLVVEDDKKIIAYLGRMPVDFMMTGEKQKGYFLHDLLVDPEYRRRGLGLILSIRLFDTWENETDSFAVSIWMNEYTNAILQRRDHYQINVHYFVKPVSLAPILMRIIRNKFIVRVIASFGNSLIGLYDFLISSRRYPDISISQIERFDQRFDTFADKISKKFPIIVLRHSKYLNWKYINRPSANYTVFTTERNGYLTGYIILLLKKTMSGDMKLGYIADILADPDDSQTIASLCQTAINFFKKENVNAIVSVITNKDFIRIFKKYLFFKRRKPIPVMFANLHKHHTRELIIDVNNWFLTLGDSDGVMWDSV